MAAVEQSQLRVSGIPCEGPPFRLRISQGFNRHGSMKAGLWVPDGMEKEIRPGMEVTLELDGGLLSSAG